MNKANHNLASLSKLYALCGNAFSLINSGNEKQAKEQFPMEYHFIKKYCPTNNEELAAVFTKKLELH